MASSAPVLATGRGDDASLFLRCVAAGRLRLARERLEALTEAVRPWRERELHWGFNDWLNAQTGRPSGRDWQTWSASMYLYATVCVERETTPFFDWVRSPAGSPTR